MIDDLRLMIWSQIRVHQRLSAVGVVPRLSSLAAPIVDSRLRENNRASKIAALRSQ